METHIETNIERFCPDAINVLQNIIAEKDNRFKTLYQSLKSRSFDFSKLSFMFSLSTVGNKEYIADQLMTNAPHMATLFLTKKTQDFFDQYLRYLCTLPLQQHSLTLLSVLAMCSSRKFFIID